MRNHYLAGLGLMAAVAFTAISCNDKPDEFPQPAYQAPDFPPFPAGNSGIGNELPINNLAFLNTVNEFRTGECTVMGGLYTMNLISLTEDTLQLQMNSGSAPNAGATYTFGLDASLKMTMANRTKYESVSGTFFISHEKTTGNIQVNLNNDVMMRQVAYPNNTCPGTGVCTPTWHNNGSGLAMGYGTTNVKFEGIDHTTLPNQAGTTAGFENFSCTIGTVVQSGSTYPITITTIPDTAHNVRVYIDFNNSGTFTDSTEMVFSSNNAKTHTGTINIPSTAVLDSRLRMRVVSDVHTEANLPSCGFTIGNQQNRLRTGQVEDYYIQISPNPATMFSLQGRLRCP